MHLYPYARVSIFFSRQNAAASTVIGLMVFGCHTKKGEQIHRSVFGKFPIHYYYMWIPQYMPFFRFHKFKEYRCLLFCLCSMLTQAGYGFHGYLIINQKKEIWFQNNYNCRFTGRKYYVNNTRKPIISTFSMVIS